MNSKHWYQTKLNVSCPRDDSLMSITVRGRYMNCGIGAYEYWGAKGVDNQQELRWELVDCPIPDEEVYDNEELCDIIEEAFTVYIDGVDQDAE